MEHESFVMDTVERTDDEQTTPLLRTIRTHFRFDILKALFIDFHVFLFTSS